MRKFVLCSLAGLVSMALALFAGWRLATDDRPLVERPLTLSVEQVGRARDIVQQHRYRVRPGGWVSLHLSAEDADTAAGYLAQRYAEGNARLVFGAGAVRVQGSFPVRSPESRYLNVDATLVATSQGMPVLRSLSIGRLRLPDAVKHRYDVRSIRHVSSTGSPCPPEVKRAMIDWWGPVFNECYGSSELGYMTYVTSAEALARPGTAGRALPDCELAILDEHGRALPAGQPGLIHARLRDLVDFSYQGNDAARQAMERDGFLTMGDVGYLDRDGYLFIVDRAADMVISGGVNIYPAEIEQALLAMPGVEDCAVFGIPHDEFGEALAAAVQARAGAQAPSADDVRAFLRERLAGYKVPAVIAFHDTLPREDTGKIFKRKLREPYWAGRTRRV